MTAMGPKSFTLLNPGPVNLTDRVRRALLHPDMCHREPEFKQVQADVRWLLESVYDADSGFGATLLTGSGTAAIEMMVNSLVPNAGRCVVVSNGAYGERIVEMLRMSGKSLLHLDGDHREPVDFPAVARALGSREDITHCVAVHMETTTGRLNDAARLAHLCERAGIQLLLDCVSSFGVEPIPFASPALQACASTAGKCLHGVSGVSFVLARREALVERVSHGRSVYLDLHRHFAAQCAGEMLFTQSVHGCVALREALQELQDGGGWRQRRLQYRSRLAQLIAGLGPLGMRPMLATEDERSSSLCTFELPPAVDADVARAFLKERGFVVYPGPPASRDQLRIAVMGALTARDIARLVVSMTEIMGSNETQS